MSSEVKTMLQDTPERFQAMAGGIVPPLIELLRGRNDLEKEICARALELLPAVSGAGHAALHGKNIEMGARQELRQARQVRLPV